MFAERFWMWPDLVTLARTVARRARLLPPSETEMSTPSTSLRPQSRPATSQRAKRSPLRVVCVWGEGWERQVGSVGVTKVRTRPERVGTMAVSRADI